MENKSFNRYWASLLEALDPRPHLACAARANGKGKAARQGVGPRPFGLARLRQMTRRRCDVAAARLGHEAGGHFRP